MPAKTPKVKHVRRLARPLDELRLVDLAEHGTWAVDLESGRGRAGCWVCPIMYEPPLNRFICDLFAPVMVKAVFEFADGTYPRGVIWPREDADDLYLDPRAFGADGTLVPLVVSTHEPDSVAKVCAKLGRSFEEVMPARFAATVECGRKVVCEGRLTGFPSASRNRRVPLWMQDGVSYLRAEPPGSASIH